MEILDDEILLTENELLYSIWTKPTLTLKYIFKYCPKKYFPLLLIVDGVVNALNRNYRHFFGHNTYSVFLLVTAIFFGGLFGWLLSYIYAAVLSWTGGWIKGKAYTDQFITIISWATVPSISSIILLIPKILTFGDGPFILDIHEQSILQVVIFVFIQLTDFLLTIWSLVILIKGIALIQNFSIKKAVLNFILSFLVVIVPILMAMGIAYIFS
jgi:Yip1 domain